MYILQIEDEKELQNLGAWNIARHQETSVNKSPDPAGWFGSIWEPNI